MHIIKAAPGIVLLCLGCAFTKESIEPIYWPTAKGGFSSYDYCPAYSVKAGVAVFPHSWGKVYVAFVQTDVLNKMNAFGAVRVGAESSQGFSLYISEPHVRIINLNGDLVETTSIQNPGSYHQKPTQWAPAGISLAALVKGPLPNAFIVTGPTIIVNDEIIKLQDVQFELMHKTLRSAPGC